MRGAFFAPKQSSFSSVYILDCRGAKNAPRNDGLCLKDGVSNKMTDLNAILSQAEQEISSRTDLKSLDDCRVSWLGKKGKITEILKSLGQLAPAERKEAGQRINQIKERVQALLESRQVTLEDQRVQEQLASEVIDVSLAGRGQNIGTQHPVSWVRQYIGSYFSGLGFGLADGPEIEDDYHNFSALNIPALHPARAMQDTFYFPDNRLLRTHMSPVQVRVMKETPPPLRIIAMGRVYRRDFDLTHTPMFHQVEGLVIDEQLSFAGLKGLLTGFLRAFFSEEVAIRFRGSYFPFTEPSAEVDIGCQSCRGKGCRICSHTGWIEVLGCGLVHPEVFQMANIDSERYSGWAFGAGLDRLAMLKFGISDLRSLFENDLRFLGQFQGVPV